MNKQFARAVSPIIAHALDLKRRLDQGHRLDLGKEQGQLLSMLKTTPEIQQKADYGGDGGAFLGARYALTSWIDELFIVYSAWPDDEWNKRKLETTLYGGAPERAWKFWKQAEMAVGRPDDLEVFFLCVSLGFRGQYLGEPRKLKKWVDEALPQVSRTGTWPSPPELPLAVIHAPLTGREVLRERLLARGGLTLLAILTALILSRILST